MALLNKNKFLYINSYNQRNVIPPEPIIKVNGGYPGTGLRNWEDKDYWYIEFVNGDAFYHYPIEKIVPEDILEKIRNGSITLCICHLHEAYHYVIENIYKDVIIDSNIPLNSILYLTNSIDIELEIDIISKKYGLPKIKTEFISMMEYVAKVEYNANPNFYTSNTLKTKKYDKKFICLNGRWAPHRTILISLLECYDLLQSGYVSYNTVPSIVPNSEDDYKMLCSWYEKDEKIYALLKNNEEKLLNLNRIYFDTTPDSHVGKACYESTGTTIYENAYFTVVTESLCFEEGGTAHTSGRTLSEKTFRTILNHNPFIILARSGTLKLLRQLGYKTFSPYIDESYDDEVDDQQRSLMVANEVKRLCDLNESQLEEFLVGCRSIVEHNFNVVLNKKVFAYSIT